MPRAPGFHHQTLTIIVAVRERVNGRMRLTRGYTAHLHEAEPEEVLALLGDTLGISFRKQDHRAPKSCTVCRPARARRAGRR